MVDDQIDIFAFLQNPANFGLGTAEIKRVDTHCAAIFLAGERAYKVKKSVRFPYLDFSTTEKRRQACAAELTLNAPGAPELYLRLRSLGRGVHGDITWDAPVALDWVVEMRRFPDDALLAQVADKGRLDDALCGRLADRIVDNHEHAPIIARSDGGARLKQLIAGIREALEHAGDGALSGEIIGGLIAAMEAEATRHAGLLDRRAASGHVRHCHGDLHLRNICLIEGEPTLFDALEFDPELATIDVLYDLAFLLMDLEQRGFPRQSSVILNRYLDRRDEEDGMVLLPLFTAMRAAIRAYASVAAGEIGTAHAYLDHATRCLETRSSVLVAIGGLSGSGKSHLGRVLAPLIGGIGGARQLRSDVLRKNLAGAASPESRLDPSAYSAAASEQVYQAMRARSARLLADGASVICDAVFARPSERNEIAQIASQAGASFGGIWLEAPPETLQARIEARSGDASDATAAVLREQLGYSLGVITWTKLDASASSEQVATVATSLLPRACLR